MTRHSFALTVQLLQPNYRVLLLGQLAGLQNGNGWFRAEEVYTLFEALRLPAPPSVSRSLGQLSSRNIVRARQNKEQWSLTPVGQQLARSLFGEFDYSLIQAEVLQSPGAEFASARHSVIPPTFAPPRWQLGINRLLNDFPFEYNIFCMTRFPDKAMTDLPDAIQSTIDSIREAVATHGLVVHLASDRIIEDDILGNVGAYMWACQYGVGILEGRAAEEGKLNQNVLIELGSMLITGRRCAILKDKTADRPPTDLSGQIYKPVDLDDQSTVVDAIQGWILNDLGMNSAVPQNALR